MWCSHLRRHLCAFSLWLSHQRFADEEFTRSYPGTPGAPKPSPSLQAKQSAASAVNTINNATEFTSQLPFIIGQAVFAILAIGIMLNISVQITILAYVPFVILILNRQQGHEKIDVEKYPRDPP